MERPETSEPPEPQAVTARRYRYRPGDRLKDARQYRAVYDASVRFVRGPLVIFSLPNGQKAARLGLSVSRRVGTAPRRNQIKRRLREAFRLMQHDWPAGYDIVISVKPHEPLILAEYQRILTAAMIKIHAAPRPALKAKS